MNKEHKPKKKKKNSKKLVNKENLLKMRIMIQKYIWIQINQFQKNLIMIITKLLMKEINFKNIPIFQNNKLNK